MKRFSLVMIVALAMLMTGCTSPSLEYQADAKAMLAKLEVGCEEMRAAIGGGDQTQAALAGQFSYTTCLGYMGLDTMRTKFEKIWSTKDEGKLRSYTLILDAEAVIQKARKSIDDARRGPDPTALSAALEAGIGPAENAVEAARKAYDWDT